MCSRLACFSDAATTAARFSVRGACRSPIAPAWNITAGDLVSVVRQGGNGRRELTALRWGLAVDHHLLGGGSGPAISVSALNIRRAALLQAIFPTNRCVVAVDAFYAGPAAKAAHAWAFARSDDAIMGFAALWMADAAGIDRVAIITTGPNESVALLQDSMPAILFPEDERAWLRGSTDPYAAHNLIMPHPAEMMRAWPVAQSAADGPQRLHRVA
jgi:putative SOS response-associated peptidase YedK